VNQVVARLDVVDVGHRPPQRHGVAAVVAHDALGPPGRARGVEHVERVGRLDLDAADRFGVGDELVPVQLLPVGVALADRSLDLLTLQDDDGSGVWLLRSSAASSIGL
jgi:hypothetical protein